MQGKLWTGLLALLCFAVLSACTQEESGQERERFAAKRFGAFKKGDAGRTYRDQKGAKQRSAHSNRYGSCAWRKWQPGFWRD